jgi:carboxypeptidase D
MLVRFIGVDLLAAAGSAAQVPSRIGNEEEAVLGETHPNGTAVVFDDPVFALPTAAPISDSAVETLVNTGSAIVVILIMLLAGGVFFVVRSRMHKKNKLSLSRGNIGLSQHNTSHELEELVVDGGEYKETSEGRYNDVVKGKGREREEIFNVGDDEEEEDEDDGTNRRH